MGVVKVSLTLDEDTVRGVKRLAGKGVRLSSIIDEMLRLHLHRVRMLALLDDMEARNPISDADRIAGEKLWAEIETSVARARSQRSTRQNRSASDRQRN